MCLEHASRAARPRQIPVESRAELSPAENKFSRLGRPLLGMTWKNRPRLLNKYKTAAQPNQLAHSSDA